MESWKVKVHSRQPTVYLWGGGSVKQAFDAILILTIRVDEIGEPIEFGCRDSVSGPLKELGSLQAGESFAVPLKGICGVWAKCVDPKVDTYVTCCVVGTTDS